MYHQIKLYSYVFFKLKQFVMMIAAVPINGLLNTLLVFPHGEHF